MCTHRLSDYQNKEENPSLHRLCFLTVKRLRLRGYMLYLTSLNSNNELKERKIRPGIIANATHTHTHTSPTHTVRFTHPEP